MEMFGSGVEDSMDTTSTPTGAKKTRNTDKTMYSHFIKTGIFVIHGRERKKVEQLKCRYCDELFLYHKVRNLRHLEKTHGFKIHSDSFSNDPSKAAGGQPKVTESCDSQASRVRASSSTIQSPQLPRMPNDPVHTYFDKSGRFVTHGREKKKVEYLKCRLCDESFLSHKIRNLKHLQKNHGYSIETNTFDPERVKPRFSQIEIGIAKKAKDQTPLRLHTSSNSPLKAIPARPSKPLSQSVYLDQEKLKKACEALTKILFIKDIPFDTFEDGSWNEFFSIIAPPFELPSAKDIGTKYLTHHYNRTIAATHDALKAAGKITLSIIETRLFHKYTFINIIACASRPYLLDSLEVGDNAVTTSYLENLLTEFLTKQKSQGIEFVALITEDEPQMKSLKLNFSKGRGDAGAVNKLLPIFCVRRCINLIVKELLNLSVVKQKLHLISSFGAEVKKNNDLKRLYEEYSSCSGEGKGTCNVPRDPRWMYDVDLMAGAYHERSVIQTILTNKDSHDLDTLLSDKSTYESMKKEDFWAEVNAIHDFMKPLHDLMLLNEASGATIADAYITMKTLMTKKDKLLKLLDRKTATSFDTKLGEIYNQAIADHHELASLLHPKHRMSEFNSRSISSYMNILKSIADCVSLTSEELSQAIKELVDYFAYSSPFDKESFETCTEHSVSAISWWKAFGAQTQLKKVALVLLSIPAFNSSVDHAFPLEASALSKQKGKLSPSRVKMLATIKFYEAFVKNTCEESGKKQASQCEMFNSRSLKAVANDQSEEPVFSDESEDEAADNDTAGGDKSDQIVIAVNSDVLGDLIQSTGIEAGDSLNYQITLPQGVAVEWNNINLRQVDSDEIQMST